MKPVRRGWGAVDRERERDTHPPGVSASLHSPAPLFVLPRRHFVKSLQRMSSQRVQSPAV